MGGRGGSRASRMGPWNGLRGRLAPSSRRGAGRAGFLTAKAGPAAGVIGWPGTLLLPVQGLAIDLFPLQEQNSECYPSTGWRYPAQDRLIAVAPILVRQHMISGIAEGIGVAIAGVVIGYAGLRLLEEYRGAFLKNPRGVMTLEVMLDAAKCGGPGYLAIVCVIAAVMLISGGAFIVAMEILHQMGR